MLLGINRLLTEVRKEYVLGNQHFTAGQVGFVFVAQTISIFPIRQRTHLWAE